MTIGKSIKDIGRTIHFDEMIAFLQYHDGMYRMETEDKGIVFGDRKTVLLGNIVDAVNGANWQRGGGKGRRPKSVFKNASNGGKKMSKDVTTVKGLNDVWK